MVRTDRIEYLMLNECTIDEDIARENMHILCENVYPTPDGGKLYTVTYDQVLTEFGRKNFNGRIYDKDPFMQSLRGNVLINQDIEKNGGLPSEYGHPQISDGQGSAGGSQSNSLARQLTLDPTMVCSMLKKYWDDRNFLKGTYETIVGGYGDILRDRIITGIPALVSSRSVGGVDARGHVLPNILIVTFDHVFRCSSQNARQLAGTLRVNGYSIPAATAKRVIDSTPMGQSMSESAIGIDVMSDSFKDFLLTESVSRDRISVVCDTMGLDYDSMVLTENTLQISRIDGNERTTVYMPLNKLVGANAYRLF